MAANPQAFDIGPLSWVKTEIEHSLSEGRTNLDKLAADPADSKSLKYVTTHLHQVTGALSMVGLGAATRLSESIEALVETFNEAGTKPSLQEHIELVKSATASLSTYLDSLMLGETDRPMMLARAYVAVNQARGAREVSEVDLFSPDLTIVVPMPDDTIALPKSEMLIESIKQRRVLYQAGLLKMLKGTDTEGGTRDMRNATLAIEALQVTSPTRAFWFTASGFFDAVAADPKGAGSVAVQLFAKIDQQIKLLIEGVQKVPERLFRDLLLVVGRSKVKTDRIAAIRSLYRLDELLAAAPDRDHAADDNVKAIIRALRDQVQSLKEYWLKFTSGNRAALEQFSQQGDVLTKQAQTQPNTSIAELLRVIGLIGPHMKKTGLPANEIQAIEVATALLFIEASLENHARLGADFAKQAQQVIARIKGAMSGTALPPLDASTSALMDDMTKRAQERLLIFQVGQEVQINLSTIESALDNFFRDPQKTAELSTLPPLFSQVQGALSILELDEAAALNQILRDRVGQFASGATKGSGEDAEAVAEGISALGLYVSALQQGAAQPRDVLLPALIRFGLATKPAEVERSLLKAPVSAADVEVDKQRVQALYEDWKQTPEATTTRDQLRDAVKELKQNAELAGDTESAKHSETTLKAIEQTFDPLKSGMTEALADIAPSKPTEAPAPQVVHLIDAPTNEIDKELLEIFLEEATEVVATIKESLDVVRASIGDRDSMTTIRRGYHTLKGSGRMVGLTDLGEVAWNCEQVMNKWLKEEKPATPGLIGFIDRSSSAFLAWVETLQAQGTAVIDGSAIQRMCDQLKNDREPEFDDVVTTPVVPVVETPAAPTLSIEMPVMPSEPVAPVVEEISLATEPTAPVELAAPLTWAADGLPAESTTSHLDPTAAGVGAPAVADADVFAELPSLIEAPVEMPPPLPSEAALAEAEAIGQDTTPISAPDFSNAQDETEEEVAIGHIRLPMPLYEIYLSEAQQHVETLDAQMSLIESNPMTPVSHEFMRAAHTLTSSSRTTGFESVADVASALEKWLHESIELVPEMSEPRLNATRQAVDTLAGMVLSLYTHEYPTPRTDVVDALLEMRDELKAGARKGSGTHIKVPSMLDLSDDVVPPPIPAVPLEMEPVVALFVDEPSVDAPIPDTPLVDAAETVETLAITPEAVPEPVLESIEPPPLPVVEEVEEVAVTQVADETPTSLEEPLSTLDVVPVHAAEPAPVAPTAVNLPFVAAAAASIATVATVAAAVSAPAAQTPTPAAPESSLDNAAFESGKDRRVVKDDVDLDLLPIFIDEARELLPEVGGALRRWRATPADHAPVTELARHLHTLKGSARMAGLMRLGELAHVMETRIIDMDRVAEPGGAMFDPLDDRLDRFSGAIESLSKGDLAPIIDVPVEVAIAAHVPAELPTPMAAMVTARAEIIAEGEKLEGRERQALLRVNADLIDRFVNEAGELAIARSRVDLEVQSFKKSMLDLNDNIARMKQQLREIEIGAETQIQSRLKEAESQGEQFDPLEFDRFSRMQELTRFLAESLNDVVTLQQSLQKNIDEADSALLQQGRLNRDLQQGLMGVRLVPLGNLQDRFYRLVRQTAKELEKKANLEFRGVRVEIDRSVLEKITAPFEHLLRNAVAHGLELPSERAAKGKSEIGEISIDARQSGNEVILTIADDGAGLNFKRIREKAIEKGLLAPDADVNDAQLTQFIFAAGFSTADTISQIAGRGVGMDVVRNEIVSLGGRIDITSVDGRGTTFTIALPLTLAVTQAVLVLVGEKTYAIPSVMIEQVQEFKGKRYEPLLDLKEIEWKGNKYPLRSMQATLGGRPHVSAQRHAYVILAKSGQQRAAVQVDAIIGNREIVVKSIGPQLARIPGIAGATVMASGQVVLIMNPVQLVFREAATVSVEHASTAPVAERGAQTVTTTSTEESVQVLPEGPSLAEAIAAATYDDHGVMTDDSARPLRANPLVMVVDDSLTVRKITSRMLLRENFEVVTAKDGVDGLQQLQDVEPDIILLDIEMPRMDGFEFARNVRADAKTKHIPIIMITSRTADKHRNHAMELGVNEYMGKPYQEDQLLALIRQYTKQQAAA
jgi:chemosensory pili system protein ChpA (sensor histidine kinase/response regulator)